MDEQVTYLPSQEETISFCVHQDELLATLMYGGVRGGKSFTACKIAQIIAQKYPRSETLICRDTRVNLWMTTKKLFFESDPAGNPIILPQLYDPRNWNETHGVLTWNNGSRTTFMGLDTATHVARMKSTQWGFVIAEEANGIGFDILEFVLYTRLSHPAGPGKMLFLTNTDHGEDELHRLFFKLHKCKPIPCEQCGGGVCQFRRVHCATLQNSANLPQKYVEGIKNLSKVKKEYAQVYVEGQFKSLEGLIYPMYDERIHILDFPAGYEWPEGGEWSDHYAYDHGYGGSPSCLLHSKVHYDGTIVPWEEFYFDAKEWTPPEGANAWTVKLMASEMTRRGITQVQSADPSIAAKNQDKGDRVSSIQDDYLENGVTMNLADNDVDGRIEKARDMMTPDPNHKNPVPGVVNSGLSNAPYVFLARVGGKLRCPHLNDQIKKRVNKVNAQGAPAGKKWTPKEGNDHALDPFEYTVNARARGQHGKKPEPEPSTTDWARQNARKKFLKEQGEMRAISSAL